MDEIKRKALEPDPAIKHRVELPGEVSVFLFLFRWFRLFLLKLPFNANKYLLTLLIDSGGCSTWRDARRK